MALQGFTGFTRVEVSSFICSPITQVFQWGEKLVSCLLKKKKFIYLVAAHGIFTALCRISFDSAHRLFSCGAQAQELRLTHFVTPWHVKS